MTEAPGEADLTIRAGLGVQASDSGIGKHRLPGLPRPLGHREASIRLCSSSFKPVVPEHQPMPGSPVCNLRQARGLCALCPWQPVLLAAVWEAGCSLRNRCLRELSSPLSPTMITDRGFWVVEVGRKVWGKSDLFLKRCYKVNQKGLWQHQG